MNTATSISGAEVMVVIKLPDKMHGDANQAVNCNAFEKMCDYHSQRDEVECWYTSTVGGRHESVKVVEME